VPHRNRERRRSVFVTYRSKECRMDHRRRRIVGGMGRGRWRERIVHSLGDWPVTVCLLCPFSIARPDLATPKH